MIELMIAMAFQVWINSAKDLETYPTVYLDRGSKSFLSVDGSSYVYGIPISENNTGSDVPYVEGKTKKCSNSAFMCVSFSAVTLVLPKSNAANSNYSSRGLSISVTRQRDGSWSGDGICEAANSSGCFSKRDYFPKIKYQYVVSKEGIVRSIKISYLAVDGTVLQNRNLLLTKGVGIVIKC